LPSDHIDPQEFTQECVQVLSIALWITFRSSIARTDVKQTVRTENKLSPVVVGIGLLDAEEDEFGGRICPVGIC
jgi:hypothetical protein